VWVLYEPDLANVSRRVSDNRLDELHALFSNGLRKEQKWIGVMRPIGGFEPLVQANDISALLDELRMRRSAKSRVGKSQWKISPVTKKLIKMEVWDVIEVGPMTSGALTTCRQTARRHMGNVDAVWHSKTLKSGKRWIERVPDGSPIHADWANPAVRQLADLEVGEKAILRSLKGKMHNGIKVQARLLMGKPDANWWCENLADGSVRVRRKK
jgi:hypothetical protein